jgi:hypothetical protein
MHITPATIPNKIPWFKIQRPAPADCGRLNGGKTAINKCNLATCTKSTVNMQKHVA